MEATNEMDEIRKQLEYVPKELKEIKKIGREESTNREKENGSTSDIILCGVIYDLLVERRKEGLYCTIKDIQNRLLERKLNSTYANTCRIITEMGGSLSVTFMI